MCLREKQTATLRKWHVFDEQTELAGKIALILFDKQTDHSPGKIACV